MAIVVSNAVAGAVLIEVIRERGVRDLDILRAFDLVPRHAFLPEAVQHRAYEDAPLPIGFGQTVSAPHMVAMMSSALQLKEGDKVLEVGTGVGYHAAVAKAAVGGKGRVTSLEFLPELVQLARKNLKSAHLKVEVHEGDGFHGWPPNAPYDAIYVTCAIPDVPDALVDQLTEGGHFVAPLGITRCQLMAGRKVDGDLDLDDLGPCLFVNAQGELGGGEDDGSDGAGDDTDDLVKP